MGEKPQGYVREAQGGGGVDAEEPRIPKAWPHALQVGEMVKSGLGFATGSASQGSLVSFVRTGFGVSCCHQPVFFGSRVHRREEQMLRS